MSLATATPDAAIAGREQAPPLAGAGEAEEAGVAASADRAVPGEGGVSRLEGQVLIEYRGQELSAPSVVFDQFDQTFTAEEGLALRSPGMTLLGEMASGNVAEGRTRLEGASFVLHQERLRGQAKQLDHQADAGFQVRSARFTRCEPQSSAWALRARRLELNTAKGYGSASHVRLSLYGMPVFYLPYLWFPTDDERSTGFLQPSLGYSEDGGTDFSLPFYFNLAPNYDLTLALRSLWRRGLAQELDFRHLSRRTQQRLSGALLKGDEFFVPPDLPEDSPPLLANRWLGTLTHQGRYGNWASHINYGAVSDLEYLRDFGSPSAARGGFSQLGSNLHTGALLRTAALAYRRGGFSGNLEAVGFQSLSHIYPGQYEALPRLNLRYGGRSRGKGLDYSMNIQAARFDRRDDEDETIPSGERLVFGSSLRWRLKSPWGRLDTVAGMIYRQYALENLAQGADPTPESNFGRFSMDARITLEREFHLFGSDLLHTITPRVFAMRAEGLDKPGLPRFDSSPTTPSYSRIFRARGSTGFDVLTDVKFVSIGIDTALSGLFTGRELLSASIGQQFFDRGEHASRAHSEDPLFMVLTAKPIRRFVARFTAEYDTIDDSVNRTAFTLKYRPDPQRVLNLSYAYVKAERHREGHFANEREMKVSFVWPIGRGKAANWRLLGSWRHTRKDRRTLESLFGLEYNGCCTRTRLVFQRILKHPRTPTGIELADLTAADFRSRPDSGVFVELHLKGLGSLGGRLSSLVESRVPGYRAPRD